MQEGAGEGCTTVCPPHPHPAGRFHCTDPPRTPLTTPGLAWGARRAAAEKDLGEAPSDGSAQDREPCHWSGRSERGSLAAPPPAPAPTHTHRVQASPCNARRMPPNSIVALQGGGRERGASCQPAGTSCFQWKGAWEAGAPDTRGGRRRAAKRALRAAQLCRAAPGAGRKAEGAHMESAARSAAAAGLTSPEGGRRLHSWSWARMGLGGEETTAHFFFFERLARSGWARRG